MNVQVQNNQRNKIQFLRGIAIIAVIIIHNAPTGEIQIWLRPCVNFCVGLFLFLSGLLSSKQDEWPPWMRIKKVYVPFIIWTVIYTVVGAWRSPEDVIWLIGKNLLTSQAAIMLYYIYIYISCQVLLPLIAKLGESKIRMAGFLIAPIEIVAMRLVPLYKGIVFPSCITSLMRISFLAWFSYFYLGYLLGNGL